MKTNNFIKILIVFIVLFIVSCGKDYKVKTIIYADGSCQRILIVTTNDSISDFFAKDYPIPIDTSWNLVIEQDTSENGDTVFVHEASKFFKSVEELNQQYVNDTSGYKVIGRTVSLENKFRWFYTFFNYQETYPKLFNQPSLKTYLDSIHYSYAMLTDEEQEKYLEEKFDTIQAKLFDQEVEIGLDKWLEFTIVNSSLDALEKSVANIEAWSMSESEFSRKKDSILDLIDGELEIFDDDDDIYVAIKRVFNIDSLLYQKLEKEETFNDFIVKYNFWEDIFLNEYVNTVTMPGLIIETNSTKINDADEVQWNVYWINYFTDDYEMFVQSRIVNPWAFWVSGGFVLFLIVIIILRKRRK